MGMGMGNNYYGETMRRTWKEDDAGSGYYNNDYYQNSQDNYGGGYSQQQGTGDSYCTSETHSLKEIHLIDMGFVDYHEGRARYQCNCAGYGIGYQYDFCNYQHASNAYGKK